MRQAAGCHAFVLMIGMGLILIAAPSSSNAQSPAPNAFPIHPANIPAETATKVESLPATRPVKKSAYKMVKGTEGHWRLAQTQDGAWWFLSPEGKVEFLNTVTTVQPFQLARGQDGLAFVSGDYDGGTTHNGNLDLWATRTLERVRGVGFKGLGAWSHPIFHKCDVPVTRDLNIWSWMHGSARRLYAPEFASGIDPVIRGQAEPLKNNRNLVGYFLDNEIDWTDEANGPGNYFDGLSPKDPNRATVMRVIESTWINIDGFNRDWRTSHKQFADLDRWQALPHEPAPAYARLLNAWIERLSTDYFTLTTACVRKYDPNHLILGVRFKGQAIREVVKASKNFTDVQSINYYPSDGQLDPEMFRMMYEVSGQPVMLSEYSFHALDGRSGNRNTVGFAAQVLDQQARADGYRLFTTRLARVPWIIGADWFQWNDEPPAGRSADGEDANFGVVDIDDRPYDQLVDAIRKTTPSLNGLHAKSPQDEGRDIWRESFADKPVARVPYLTRPIKINGELSDWPKEARISGIRHSQTMGLERSKIPLPNVYLGWREEGLYMGAEIFDNDILGAPAQGWWWARDHIEFWISTKPVASDQEAYDANCHRFFFVPNSFADDGNTGTVGQWHRDGDAIKQNLIPHPLVKEACRIFPDRYVVEMFIPAKALHGYDPAKQTAMAFNIHVRNFQHALDYFWSAPKDVMTAVRPSTWGPIYLEAPGKARGMVQAKGIPATQPTASAR